MRSADTTGRRPARRGEALSSAALHGAAAFASLAGTGVLLALLPEAAGPGTILGLGAYGASLFGAYLASALFHGLPSGGAKRFFRSVDHCAIYLLIAGSYTPFAAILLWDGPGPVILTVIWSLAVLGIALRLLIVRRLHWSATVLYLAMGWLCLAWLPALYEALGSGIWLLLGGGLAYTVGLGFFGASRLPYGNLVWHLFVIAGSACHFAAVLLYVVPRARA